MLNVDYRALVSRADLIYQLPVEHPVHGQPIGNGRMGTLVWTTPGAIHFQINRSDVFAVDKHHAGSYADAADYCSACAQVTVEVGGEPLMIGNLISGGAASGLRGGGFKREAQGPWSA